MAKHEFGIMQNAPEKGKRYDEYEPQKYNCISVDDVYVEKLDEKLIGVDFYWHTTDVSGKGLAYCGVTLIHPESILMLRDAVKNEAGLSELKTLAEKAYKENKWIIHFGL